MTVRDETILANLVANRMAEMPDKKILTFVSVGADETYSEEYRTYSSLWQEGQKCAHALTKAGMQKGERFALLLQNHPEFVDAMVGSSILGTVFVPIDPRKKRDELIHMINFVECKGIVCADYSFEQILEVLPSLPTLEWVWVIGSEEYAQKPPPTPGVSTSRWSDVIDIPGKPIDVMVTDPTDTMQMLYTSGTTGHPKAIEASYARYYFGASFAPKIGFLPEDRPYTGLSLSHANAQIITLGAILFLGMEGVISRKFSKSRLWDICRRYNCTFFNLLGGMTTAIYSEPEQENDADNPVRCVLSAGMPAAIWDKFRKRFNVDIFEFYGAAEGGLTLNPPRSGPVGSIGKAPEGMIVSILDDDGNECPPFKSGEIVFKNADDSKPIVNYYRNPEASHEKTAGGLLWMGDVGHKDDEGWVYFDYRKGSGIRRNGEFVDIAAIEKVLAEDPQITDVFVYGVKAANGTPGEKDIIAAIVPFNDAVFDVSKVFANCCSLLTTNYVPAYFQVMTAIPKTASEKPQERYCIEHFHDHPEAVYASSNFAK